MTNHHVASDILDKLSTSENNLLDKGFWAPTIADELACPDVHLDVLWTIEDVTDRVNGAADGLSSADAGAARLHQVARAFHLRVEQDDRGLPFRDTLALLKRHRSAALYPYS